MNTHTRRLAALSAAALATALTVGISAPTTYAAQERQSGKQPFQVSAAVSDDEPEQGETVTIKGQVRPPQPGRKVLVQVRYDTTGKWKTKDKVRLNRKSKYRYSDQIKTVQFRQYRVVMPRGSRPKGVSDKIPVTVFGWRDLTTLSPVGVQGMSETSKVTMNAVDYPSSLRGYNTNNGDINYNLNRQCKEFEGRFGIDDVSEATATGTLSLDADAVEVYEASFGLTESAQVTRDVSGVFRITVRWTSSNTAGTVEDQSGAIAAVGTPRVLCSF